MPSPKATNAGSRAVGSVRVPRPCRSFHERALHNGLQAAVSRIGSVKR